MFKLLNLTSKYPVSFEISNKGEKLEFIVGSIINKRNKDELCEEHQFTLLNAYLDYEGDEFKDKLFKLYQQALMDIDMALMNKELRPIPKKMVSDIIAMFDIPRIFYYIKEIYKIQPPSVLKDTFDPSIEDDGKKTRVQTFIKDDYFELVSTALVVKSILGPIGHFGYVKSGDINVLHKEYMLYSFIAGTTLDNTPAITKVRGFIDKLMEIATREVTLTAVTVIKRQLPKSALGEYILAIVVLQKISMAVTVTDTADKHIISRIYTTVISKLQNKGDSSNKISDKKALTDVDGGDKESIVEAFRVISTLTSGFEIELDWSVSNIDKLIRDLPIDIDRNIVLESRIFATKVIESGVDKKQINILSYIFKGIIDPRGMDYISKDSLINLMSVGFAYLWTLNHKQLAILIMSVAVNNSNEVMTINSTVSRARLTTELKEELNVVYPYTRKVNDNKYTNVVEDTINDIANSMFNKKWVTLADDKYVEDALGVKRKHNILPNDIKILLAKFILENERILNG